MKARALSILVADDNVDAAQTLALLFTLDGHRVDTAFDGEQALRHADARLPDVAVLDLLMPRLDGQQVAQRLRARATPVRPLLLIALSGSIAETVPRCGEIDAYFAKPVDFPRLDQFIREWSLQLPRTGCH